MLPRVLGAQLVSVKVIKGKRRVLNAVQANSMTLKVPVNANYVPPPPTLVKKEETALASIVPRGGCPPVAAPNAKRAVRERSVMVAKIAHWDLQDKEMTLMQHNADNVNWVKQRRLKVRPRAVGVI